MSVKQSLFSTILISFSLILYSLFFIQHVNAAENFTTQYAIIYQVKENGQTSANLAISLVNTTSQYYASSYKMQLGFENITNIKAYDGNGSIKPEITKNSQGGYDIALNFNNRVVGIGKTMTFNLSFDTPDIARKNGKIWEINIPGIVNQNDFSEFNVEVRVPKSFGKPTFIKPQQSRNSLVFNKEQLGKSGISITFGNRQYFAYNLVYHLKNSNVFPVKTQIALPPTTNYQEVSLDSLSTPPVDVIRDVDGNWLAEYQLLPSQKLDVIAKGNVQLRLIPQRDPLTQKELSQYLSEKSYWQTSNPEIKKLAQTLKTPEAIYNYVVKNLTYDFSRVTSNKPRLGAASVLRNPSSAVCLEFTDLFIALSRAAGIPAREVNGFAFTENSRQRPLSLVADILHAWPEYYDREKETWVMVDPTWGNTTGGVDYFNILDFDHFTFVIKGLNSSFPIPAGGYKYSGDEQKKDVNVMLSENTMLKPALIQIVPNFSPEYASAIPIRGEIKVRNIGNSMSETQEIKITSSLSPNSQLVILPKLPPFGSYIVPVEFNKTSFLTNKNHKITIQLAGLTTTSTIRVSPLLLANWKILGGIIGVISLLILLIVTLKTRRVSIPQ